MAGGIGGFADGFSSGLNQGMGIIHANRQDKRAQAEQEMRFRQMEHSMKLQDSQEGRAAETFQMGKEDREWNHTNLRPLQLKEAELRVDKYEQDIKIGGLDYAKKQLDLEWAPKIYQQNFEHADNADDRAERGLDWQIESGRAHLAIARNADNRAAQQQDFTLGAQVAPLYYSLKQRGLEVPPMMEEAMRNSPFGTSHAVELARASDSFEGIMASASKGDFSFMRDGEKSESAFALSRPVGMRIANQKGYDPTSARVTGITPQKGAGVVMTVQAYDPKTKRFVTFRHGVNPNHLAGEMEKSARMGIAIKNHPAYAQMEAEMPQYAAVYGGDVRAAASKQWAENYDRYSKVARERPDEPDGKQAAAWLAQNSNEQEYVQRMAGGAFRAGNVRGDTSRNDFNRLYSTVQQYNPNVQNSEDAMVRANTVLGVMDRLGKVDKGKVPNIYKMLEGLVEKNKGVWSSDPAIRVKAYYEIERNPALRSELAKALSGGQGAGNPSGGRYTPISNAKQVGTSIFGADNITSSWRDPNSKLAKANPKSWHHNSHAAIDVRPIPGMSFAEARRKIEERGYRLIEAKNEVGAGRSKHATGDHWHFVLGRG